MWRGVNRRELLPLEVLWQEAAEHMEQSPEALRSSERNVWGVETRDGVILRTVCEAGFWAISGRLSSAFMPPPSTAPYRDVKQAR